MPNATTPAFQLERDDERRLLFVRVRRTLTREDLASLMARQLEEGTWTYGTLYDMTYPLAGLPWTERQEVTRDAQSVAVEAGRRGAVAIVIVDDATYATASGWAHTAGHMLPYPIEVFRTIDDAERWLLSTRTRDAEDA